MSLLDHCSLFAGAVSAMLHPIAVPAVIVYDMVTGGNNSDQLIIGVAITSVARIFLHSSTPGLALALGIDLIKFVLKPYFDLPPEGVRIDRQHAS